MAERHAVEDGVDECFDASVHRYVSGLFEQHGSEPMMSLSMVSSM
ncbi:hypothetical protein ACU635_60475 [[Actinomadura] parvosata]